MARFWWWETGNRVERCLKCSKGIRPSGKVCKYCNGTGVITRPNQK